MIKLTTQTIYRASNVTIISTEKNLIALLATFAKNAKKALYRNQMRESNSYFSWSAVDE